LTNEDPFFSCYLDAQIYGEIRNKNIYLNDIIDKLKNLPILL